MQISDTLKNEPEPLYRERNLDYLYWVLPVSIVLVCIFGALYALLAPPEPIPLNNPEARKLIPVVTDKMFWCDRQETAIGFSWTIINTIILMTFLQSGLAFKLSKFAESKTSNLILQVLIFTGIWVVAIEVLTFPMSYLSGFVFSHYYALSSQSFGDWLVDYLKSLVMQIALEVPMWALLLFFIRKFPTKWPYLQVMAGIPIMLFMTFISPILLAPVFNQFTLMQPSPLCTDIKKLAAKAGIPDAPIFVVDKSKQTNTINAYVSGLGSSQRIVIWDTTLKKLPNEQILCVVAHELGHYALNHVLMACSLAILAGLWTIPVNLFLTPVLFKNMPKKWGNRQIQDLSSIAIFIYVSHCGGFWLAPLESTYSRIKERDADMYGLKIHHDPKNFARTYAFLATENLSEPCPPKLFEIWLYSHPPLATRIKYVMDTDVKN